MGEKVAPKPDKPCTSAAAAEAELVRSGFGAYLRAARSSGFWRMRFSDRRRKVPWRKPLREVGRRLAREAAHLRLRAQKVPAGVAAQYLAPVIEADERSARGIDQLLSSLSRDDWPKRALRVLIYNARSLPTWTRDEKGRPKRSSLPPLTPKVVALVAIATGAEEPCDAERFPARRTDWKKRLAEVRQRSD